MSRVYQSSRPPHCVSPRPYSDPTLRRIKHGAIHPMDYPRRSIWQAFRRWLAGRAGK
jgi:hypothetical protein